MRTTRILAALELFLLMLKPNLTAESKPTNLNPTLRPAHSQIITKTVNRNNFDQTSTQWAPFMEWERHNSSYQGNPFDLDATVIFIQVQSGENRKTEIFYNGNSRWKFRFTGARTGIWTFLSASSDPDIDNLSGTVTITPNPDPNVKGLLTAQGQNYERQTGENGMLEAIVPKVYMNLRFTEINKAPFLISRMSQKIIREFYLQETIDLGFNAIFINMNNQWFEFDAMSYEDHNSTAPDVQSFEVLEAFIAEAHQAGLQTIIWAWGDELRKWMALYRSDWAIAIGQFEDGSRAAWSAVLTFDSQKPNVLMPAANSSTIQLVLGGHDSATDGLDIGFDKPAPPPPPGSGYYAAFLVPETKIYLSQDIRGWREPFDEDIDWPITVFSAEGTESELRWNSESFPTQGSFFLIADGKEIDMRSNDSFKFIGSTTLSISYQSEICHDFDFPIDDYAWYLISLPLVQDDNSVKVLFPDAFAAFTWDFANQQYAPSLQMEAGCAYWLLFLKASKAHICGQQINDYTKKFQEKGWDLVSSVNNEAPPLSDPEDALAAMFRWDIDNQLLIPTETNITEPGQGYWILVAKAPSTLEVNIANQSGNGMNKMASFINQEIASDLTPPAPPHALIETPVLAKASIPNSLNLLQNYPNPFNLETTIEFHLPEKRHVVLKIYSILGKEIKTLVNTEKNAGIHRSVWDAKDNSGHFVGSGIYLLQMQAGDVVQSRRIILLK